MNVRGSIFGRLREERGISTAIAAISLIGLFGAALLSLDFGSMWSSRRNIITATDSTALDQARKASLTLNPTACSSNWTDYLYRNSKTIVASSINCTLHAFNPEAGYVTVEGRNNADTRFGGLFGLSSTQPYSLSAAQYGFGSPQGLRPMSFCLLNAHVMQWVWYQNWLRVQRGQAEDPNFGKLDETTYNLQKGTLDAGHPPVTHYPKQATDTVLFLPPIDGRVDFPQADGSNGLSGVSYASYGVVHRMFFTKDDVYESGNCGASSGNWGWIDYSRTGGGTKDLNDWIINGYDGQAAKDDCNANDSTPPPQPCSGDSGSSGGATQQELQTLVDSQAVFFIPIFTNVANPGTNADFTIWGFLPLVLRGFQVTGSQDSRYFDFEFKDAIASTAGGISNTGGIGSAKVVAICEVDHDGDTSDAQIASRCGG